MKNAAGIASAQERTASRLLNAESPFPCGRDVPRFLAGVAAIALCSSLLGTVLPGLVAAETGVFYTDHVRHRIQERVGNHPSLKPAVTSFTLQNGYEAEIEAIGNLLAGFVKGLANPNDKTITKPIHDVATLRTKQKHHANRFIVSPVIF